MYHPPSPTSSIENYPSMDHWDRTHASFDKNKLNEYNGLETYEPSYHNLDNVPHTSDTVPNPTLFAVSHMPFSTDHNIFDGPEYQDANVAPVNLDISDNVPASLAHSALSIGVPETAPSGSLVSSPGSLPSTVSPASSEPSSSPSVVRRELSSDDENFTVHDFFPDLPVDSAVLPVNPSTAPVAQEHSTARNGKMKRRKRKADCQLPHDILPYLADSTMSYGGARKLQCRAKRTKKTVPLPVTEDPLTFKGQHATVILDKSSIWKGMERDPRLGCFKFRVDGVPKNFPTASLTYTFKNLIETKKYLLGLKMVRKSGEISKKYGKSIWKEEPSDVPESSEELLSDEATGATLMAKGMFWKDFRVSGSGSVTNSKFFVLMVDYRHKYNIQLTVFDVDGDSARVLEVVEFPETEFLAVSHNNPNRKDRKDTGTPQDSGENQEELQVVPEIDENRNEGMDMTAAFPARRASGTLSDSEQVPEERLDVPENDQNQNQGIDVAAAFPADESLITSVGTHATVTLGYGEIWREKKRKPGQEYFRKRLDGNPKNVSPPLAYQLNNLNAEKIYEFGVKFVRPADASWRSEEAFSEQATGANLEGKTLCFEKMLMANPKTAANMNAEAKAEGKPEIFMHVLPYRHVYLPVLTIYEIVGETRSVLEMIWFRETMFLATSDYKRVRTSRKSRKVAHNVPAPHKPLRTPTPEMPSSPNDNNVLENEENQVGNAGENVDLPVNKPVITYKGDHATVSLVETAFWKKTPRKLGEDYFSKEVNKISVVKLKYRFENLMFEKVYEVGVRFERKSELIGRAESNESAKANVPRYSEEQFFPRVSGADLGDRNGKWFEMVIHCSKKAAEKPITIVKAKDKSEIFPHMLCYRHKYNVVLRIYEVVEDETQLLEKVEFDETTFLPMCYQRKR